jgi:hypothetical protein
VFSENELLIIEAKIQMPREQIYFIGVERQKARGGR